MNLPLLKEVSTEIETKLVAYEFAKLLKPGDIVSLTGSLGSGKTFFVKAVCESFGIYNVSSPSFAIVNVYDGTVNINHFDFYRIKKIEELYDIGFNEYLNNDSITFIEWAEMFPQLVPVEHFKIVISFIDMNKRQIAIEQNG